ncbi:hypothetical protein, partial [Bradyrhizobium ottawaense]
VAALILAGTFWFVDLPQTVRLKAAIVRILPLPPATKIATIEELCKGARPNDSASCYLAFRSEEAEAMAACDKYAEQVRRSKNWVKTEGDSYSYRGKDTEFSDLLLFFHPSQCAVVSVAKQIAVPLKDHPSIKLPP